MSFFPRPRQACQPVKGPGPGPTLSAGDGSPVELPLPDPNEEANVALLSGTIAEEPLRDKSRDGDPVTVLLVAFDAPDEKARGTVAVCDVEVPDEIADIHRKALRAGRRLVVLGRLTGAGGLWATAIVTRQPKRPPRT
jgi:Single-strand binding protein family